MRDQSFFQYIHPHHAQILLTLVGAMVDSMVDGSNTILEFGLAGEGCQTANLGFFPINMVGGPHQLSM